MQSPGRPFFITWVAALLSLADAPRALHGQTLGVPPIMRPALLARFPAEVRAAEAAGAAYPRPRTTSQRDPRRCVDASGSAAESGEFHAGPFDAYPAIWRQGTGKLWWRPASAAQGETLLVRATSLDDPNTVRVYHLATTARVGGTSGVRTAASGPLFYPSRMHLPKAGPWLLVASVGKNWGCFLLLV